MKPSQIIHHRRDLWKVIAVPGNSAEIGVAEGFFSADILSWRTAFPTHYLVDRWRCNPGQRGDGGHGQEWHDANLRACKERMLPYRGRAEFLRGDSTEMAKEVKDNELALLYIDGDHSYEGVIADLKAWTCKVKKDGIIAFHDYEMPQYGVKRAVRDFAAGYGATVYLLSEDKPEDAGAFFFI